MAGRQLVHLESSLALRAGNRGQLDAQLLLAKAGFASGGCQSVESCSPPRCGRLGGISGSGRSIVSSNAADVAV